MQPATESPTDAGESEITLDNFYAKKEQVPKFWRGKYDKEANKFWDKFYQNNTTNFFKDRHWLLSEFPELKTETTEKKYLLEVGCGVGNTIFPLLDESKGLFVYGVDFSQKAIQLVKGNALYDTNRCAAFVSDIGKHLPSEIPLSTIDVTTLIFVLSALTPERMPNALKNLFSVLKPGGVLLLRDYAANDLAQNRLQEKDQGEKKLGENFYVRGDGTQVYYFTIDYITKLLSDAGFKVASANIVEREVVNRKSELTMNRTFIQVRAIK